MSNFKVGDEVYLTSQSRKEPLLVTITRVGRKWAYVEAYSREYAFDKVTGRENCTIGYPDRIQTVEMMVEAQRRGAAIAELKACGFVPDGYGDFSQSTDILEAIVEILEQGAPHR